MPGVPDKTFRPFDPDQTFLVEQDPSNWLPDDHIVFFVEQVLDELDYTPFYDHYEDGDVRGYPPYDPRLMVRIIAYGCTTGVRSSRKLAKACVENVAFRYLARGNQPKKSAICEFHNRHRDELIGVLVQLVQLAQAMGLIDTDAIAIDGTKMAGSASLDANQAYEELVAEEAAIEASLEAWFAEIDAADEQATEGSLREDQLPPGLQGRKDRLERIREAKDLLEELGRENAKEQEDKWGTTRLGSRPAAGRR